MVNRRLLGAVTVGGSGARQEGDAGQLPRGAGGSLEEGEDDVVVRELLPRARSVEPRKEVVTTRYSEEDPANYTTLASLQVYVFTTKPTALFPRSVSNFCDL